jgi:predicted DNA-binding protein (UPF0251 family)
MIGRLPDNTYFTPKGIPASELKETVLTLDEYEALKLADYEQRYQEQAAEAMHISRQTFGRIIESAHYKIAAALILGHAIRIEGGEIAIRGNMKAICRHCKHTFERPNVKPSDGHCQHCKRTIDAQIT